MSLLHSRSERTFWVAASATVVSLAFAGYGAILFRQLILDFGWEGTVRYLWEGDPRPEAIRHYVDSLNLTDENATTLEELIMNLEVGLKRALSEALEEPSKKNDIVALWQTHISKGTDVDIKKYLASVSYDLDQLAARVDQVPLQEGVRHQKKFLSRRIVGLMTRADALIASYTTAVDTVLTAR